VTQYAEEPTIPNRVSLETVSGVEWQPHRATIANLTRHEVWIGLEESLGELLYPERKVRLILRRPDGGTQTAETIVLWHIGSSGLVVALMRPTLWDPPSRRAHSRARLAIPVHLRLNEDAPPVLARTTDVGVGGFHCLSDTAVAVGQRIAVTVLLTPAQSFDCQAEVVRLENDTDDPSGRQVVLALRFLDLSGDDQATLATALVALADDVDADSVPLAWRSPEASRRPDA
jgi:hypothetical protein